MLTDLDDALPLIRENVKCNSTAIQAGGGKVCTAQQIDLKEDLEVIQPNKASPTKPVPSLHDALALLELTSKCTPDEAKASYRRKAYALIPDRHPSKVEALSDAFECLSAFHKRELTVKNSKMSPAEAAIAALLDSVKLLETPPADTHKSTTVTTTETLDAFDFIPDVILCADVTYNADMLAAVARTAQKIVSHTSTGRQVKSRQEVLVVHRPREQASHTRRLKLIANCLRYVVC